jgi:flagellar L-ring protein FlgH
VTRRCGPILIALGVAGCAVDPRDVNQAPHMTPVGSGIERDYAAPPPLLPTGPTLGPQMPLDGLNLYRDLRAARVGDVVTVTISMDDKAVLGNSTDRSRNSEIKTIWSFLFDFIPGTAYSPAPGEHKWSGQINNDLQSSSTTNGQGSINRSEQIKLSIAAIVTDVLPNGNLVLRGSQEIRVNQELRELTIAGIARPRDISKDNIISYDKIAEARISYGGRGRLMEVQQPALGQQLYDIFAPF